MNIKHLSILCFFALFLSPPAANSQTPGEISGTHDVHGGPAVDGDRYLPQWFVSASETPLGLYNRLMTRFISGRSLPPLSQALPSVNGLRESTMPWFKIDRDRARIRLLAISDPVGSSSQTPSLDLPADPTDPPLPPAVEAALNAMKARIAELETELRNVRNKLDAAPAQGEPQTAPTIPDALTSPPSSPSPDNFTPFAYADFTWLNGYFFAHESTESWIATQVQVRFFNTSSPEYWLLRGEVVEKLLRVCEEPDAA